MKQIMLLHITAIQLLHFAKSQQDTTGCSPTPLKCLDPANAIDFCSSDTDCLTGERCCYKSCYKQCVKNNPCSNVICAAGYLCTHVTTPCVGVKCRKEASCVLANAINCPSTSSTGCPAGYERLKDQYGCPFGACLFKKQCSGVCKTSCAYGKKMDANGCPICECKPDPANPCTNVPCKSGTQCRMVTMAPAGKTSPTPLTPGCLPKTAIPSAVDMSCGVLDPTTVGLPILNQDAKEIDCSKEACPSHSVCVGTKQGMRRCCWQHTQTTVTAGPKIGQCPPGVMFDTKVATKCEVDASCPGTLKCCYVNKMRGKTEYTGLCQQAVYATLNDANTCKADNPLLWFYKMLGLCK